MPHDSNCYRPIPSNTLHIRYFNSILISYSHLPRRKLRLINPIFTRQRGLNILHLLIPSRRTRNILRILHFPRNMKYRSCPSICSHSNRIYRLCSSMRTNIILRGHRNHKPIISYSIYWHHPSRMNLRRLLSRQSNPNTFFRISLYPPIHHCRSCNCTPPLPPRNRIKQPHRTKFRRRQNPISPILYNQRPTRSIHITSTFNNPSTILPRLTRRPRQLHTC